MVCGLLVPMASGCRHSPWGAAPPADAPPATPALQANGRMAAPGILEPRNGNLALAAPVGPLGVTPRVEALYVQAGDAVRQGQVLARFDNYEGVRREIEATTARIEGLRTEIAILEQQTRRFESLRAQGVLALADFEERSLRLAQLRNARTAAERDRRVLEERLRLAQLVAPISGEVLSVNARPGEQAGPEGVLELAATGDLVVKAQVEEAAVGGLVVGQPVEVMGENADPPEPLRGRVSSIAARVSPRRSLSLRPGAYRDSEPRVVDVTISLDPGASRQRGVLRSGSKVLVIFLDRPAADR